MTRLLSLVLFITSTGLLFGQDAPKGRAKISGVVIDATTNQPIEYATIALVDPTTNKPVDGTVCDDKGKFTLNKIAEGKYNVVISFIGFETQTHPVTVDEKNDNLDFGNISLKEKQSILNEVTVEAEKVLIEEKVDRTIYNAENDATTAGGDATDVLKRVPMLSVDLDGNVSMRGNSNVRVLINNRPSTIAASSIADALKMIPADQIKSVEVITSPSAKYDAEGSAGIINIITKKNTLQGATLGIDTGVGLRGSNLGLNGNLRTQKMGFSLGGWGRASYNVHGDFENEQLTRDIDGNFLSLQRQTADTRNNFLFGRYNLGWDYDINKYNFINASVSYGLRGGRRYQDDQLREKFDENNTLISSSLLDSKTEDQSGTVDVNFNFTHTYDKPQKELSFSTQYSRNNRTNDFLNTNFLSEDVVDYRIKNINDSYDQEITLQFDYQTPINDNQMVEFGAKEIMRKVSSDYAYFRAEGSDGAYVPDGDATNSNIFNYNQNISAGYLSYTFSTKNSYSFKTGARYEYTTIKANFENPEGGETDLPAYGVLVPSINVSKKLGNGNMVKLAYNKRIQRPSIRFLNPNIDQSNPLNISFGNPNLDPEYTDNFELSYSTFIKGTSLNFSTFVRNTSDAIQNLREVVRDSVIQTTYANIGQESAYGGSVFANVNIGKLSLNGGFDVYYSVLDNNVPTEIYRASNEGWVVSGRLFGNYSLPKDWGLQFFGFARGRDVQLQGVRGNFRMYSLAVRKQFDEKRGSIGFGAENFITPSLKIKNELNSPTLVQKNLNTMYNLSFRINFSYRIGKMSFDSQPRKRRTINNDDLKQGGDNGMDGGGMQGNMGGNGQVQGTQGRRGTGIARPATENKLPAADPTAEVNAVGTWSYTIDSPQGGEGTLTINKEEESYQGTIFNKRFNKDTPLSAVTLNGNELSFSYEAGFGGNQMTISVKAVITGDEMTGNMTVGQFGTFPIHAKRSE